MKLIAARTSDEKATSQNGFKNVLQLANDTDPQSLDLKSVDCIELQFPKFTDGRAFSQAFLLRHRLGFQGVLRATGDVLIDQLQQMQRTGFSEAVLRADQDLAHGTKLLNLFPDFYQGDAQRAQPHFARSLSHAGPPQVEKAPSGGSATRAAANVGASS
ncbi:MAG: DUF934 domain-containing protein [Burkholderiaceae bacterium]